MASQTSIMNSFVPQAIFIAHYARSCPTCQSQNVPNLGKQLFPLLMALSTGSFASEGSPARR